MLHVHDIDYAIDPVLRKPAVRVVLSGCPLRCVWCDVPETHFTRGNGGVVGSPSGAGLNRELETADVLGELKLYNCDRVLVTGGEPLAQASTPELLTQLCDAQHETWVDTAGSHGLAVDPEQLDPRVRRLVDVKCPGSGMQSHNIPGLLGRLRATDIAIFTVVDRHDYEWAKAQVRNQTPTAPVCFAVARGHAGPHAALSDWVLDDGLNVSCLLEARA